MVKISRVRNKSVLENLLLGGILALALFMYFFAFTFRGAASQFPQYTSAVTAICAFLLLVWPYLPEPIQNLKTDASIIDPGDIESITEDNSETKESTKEINTNDIDSDNSKATKEDSIPYGKLGILPLHYHTALISIGYVIGGYLVGLLWTTPIAVFLYGWLSNQSWTKIIVLVIISIIIPVLFIDQLNIGLSEGYLHDEGIL